MRLRSWGALGAFAVLAALIFPCRPLPVPMAPASKQLYIVRMLDEPVAAYEGGTAGIPATKPAKGKKINDKEPNVVKYAGYLDGKHVGCRQEGRREKMYDYRFGLQRLRGQAD